MSSDYLERTKEGSVFVGSDVTLFQVAALSTALGLYAKTGIKVNRAYTPSRMLLTASQLTGLQFKGLTKYSDAARALHALVERMKAERRRDQ